ncbi:hypothetical protein [Actinotalea sp. C106]|uniref:hypothetical protein n=1 Tax=Actinotalea sp. C106 TaxID=2908644 RepID=UPI002027D521|nr:hypothetical protein [Actinotalea sp. C106]
MVELLDLDSRTTDSLRREKLEEVVGHLADYLREHLSLESVRKAYSRGDFSAAFVRKDARGLLCQRPAGD